MPIFEYKCQKCGHIFENIVLDKSQSPRPEGRGLSREVQEQLVD